MSTNYDRVETHVVFVHGLSGHIEKTWKSKIGGSTVFWPSWLEDDVTGLGIWLVGFNAAKTNWGGYGIPIVDRASGILARLLVEPRLTKGNIIFISHSLGGLVVEQILRTAHRDGGSENRANEFLRRVKGVVFLGTPHKGSFLATISKTLQLLFRPSDATRDLLPGSPLLRDLNYWYRQYSQNNSIQNLILAEGKPLSVLGVSLPKSLGTAVSVDSADAGLQAIPIIVDETHRGICKPVSRDAEVYIQVRHFVRGPFDNRLQVTRTDEFLENTSKELQRLGVRTEQQSRTIEELKKVIIKGATVLGGQSEIVDAELKRRLNRLSKCRIFAEFDAIEETRSLVTSIEDGELVLASKDHKQAALGWCARFLSGEAPAEAAAILNRMGSVNSEVSSIARSLIKASSGDLEEAIRELCAIGTPVAYGAAYISVLRGQGLKAANDWLRMAGLAFSSLDSDAKFFYVRKSVEESSWDVAVSAAREVKEEECERSPGLFFATGDAFLMQAVPDELRTFFLTQNLPFNAATFPLRGDPLAFEYRRNAIPLYKRLHSIAEQFGLQGVAGLMDDKALWLRLVDPEHETEAQEELEESIRNPTTFLRRLGLGLQFGVDVDLEWAEREVDRQTALSGGTSPDAAFARFALALSKNNHGSVATYIDEHRNQLLQHLDWRGVYAVEVEMLAGAGQTAKAEERLSEAIEKGLSEPEIVRLRRALAEASGGDPIAERLAAYKDGGSIIDLRILVAGYKDAQDWQNACEYGQRLVDISGDLTDARNYVISLYNVERHNEAIRVLEAYPALWTENDFVRRLRVQVLFESGRLKQASAALQTLRQSWDSPEARQLHISLAIVSGDWESLQGFVEHEWNARNDRTAIELLRAGQIAQSIGAVRGKKLVQEAAARADNNPEILVGCFQAASAAGWENSIEVHRWMERAAKLSSGDGPVQTIAFQEILEKTPDWERRESTVWELLERGDTPVFAAGQGLNRSLLSLYLMPALNNLDEPDVRRRSMIYAFSGVGGKAKVKPNVVAMDATALITAEFLDLLDVYIEEFDNVVIPHCTLGWLLGEKARILFHQPSRVVAARELRQMITDGHLHMFEGSDVAPERLVAEVGASFAALISDASSAEHQEARQRLVVRGGPVHKANSSMLEEADLSEYESYLCSGIAVVNKLAQKGVLTHREAEEARAALNIREIPWTSEPQIADEAVLYLDYLAVSNLQALGLLSRVHRAGVTAFVSRKAMQEADALISYDVKASDVVSIVERLRLRIREGLETEKVRLGKAVRGEDSDGPEHVSSHPTVDMLGLVTDADVGMVDDRFINQHVSMSMETVSRPLITTVDMLDVLVERGSISENRRQEALTTLRQANFALTPLTSAELNALMATSTVSGEMLDETAELRAIRESVQRVRMSNMLQAPKELAWLNGVTQACQICLKEQWKDSLDEETAVARSDWLLALSDVRGWTHRVDENVDQLLERYRSWVLVLMTSAAEQQLSVKEAYWRWFDSRVLEPLQEEDPDSYRYVMEWAKKHVAGIVDACEKGIGRNND